MRENRHNAPSEPHCVHVGGAAYNDGIAFRHVAPGEGTRVPAKPRRSACRGPACCGGTTSRRATSVVQRKTLGLRTGWPATLPAAHGWLRGDPHATRGQRIRLDHRGGTSHYSGMVLRVTAPAACTRGWACRARLWQFLAYRPQFSAERFASRRPLPEPSPRPGGVMMGADLMRW